MNSTKMKTFHVSILYSTSAGPVVEMATVQASTPIALAMAVASITYDTESDLGWVCISAIYTEIKETIDVARCADLALAN